MTDTTARDLIQRMAKELDCYRQLLQDDRTSTHPLADEARVYLSQSEPEGPTDEELHHLWLELYAFHDGPTSGDVAEIARAVLARWGRPAVEPEPEDKVLARVEFAKRDFNGPSDAILAQYCDDWFYGDPSRTEVDPVDLCRGAIRLFAQIPAPTPVSERLPGPEDCSHPEGECWWFDPASDGAWYIDTYQGNYTYWLPHYALPVPAATEKP